MRLEGNTVLVTGGAGFIGSHLVDALQAYPDCRVRVLDDLSTGRTENLAHLLERGAIELFQGSVTDAATAARAVEGVAIVFHLACRGVRHSIGQPLANHEVNAQGTLLLLGAARAAGVSRFVHVSSSEVYGTARHVPMDEDHPCFPETVYGAAKLAGEAYARAYHQTYQLPTVVVRPFNNFGPRSHFEGDAGEVIPRFAVWALNGKPPVIFGDGTQTRDFIYVADTAHWLCQVAECDALVGQTVNLASGRETSVRELARLVCTEAGRPDLKPVYRNARPGDVQRHLASVSKAERLVGFQVQTGIRAGVVKLLAHLRRQPQGMAELLRQVQEINWKAA
jgi:UDP-glucose 4-epimerase